ncbi:C6 zinc finger domain protein [Colletotrichum asianum]
MSLGPQCWRCRKRRLRCDSSLPSCLKCALASVACPGYAPTRPIAWRNPLLLTSHGIVRVGENGAHEKAGLGRASVMGIVCRAPRSVRSEVELRIAADAIEYYNLHVAPDLVPYATERSPYQISPSEIGELAEYVRKSYISIAALHRFVSGEPAGVAGPRGMVRSAAPTPEGSDISELMAAGDFKSVHFASQAAAIRALSEELGKHQADQNGAGAGPEILLGIMLMLSSQIQYSAYAPWQAHIHGAWSLIAAQGGMEVLAKANTDLCRVLQQVAVVDIFGMSTHCLTEASAKTVLSRYTSYAMIFDESMVEIANPWTLMPNGLARTINQINMLRAENLLLPSIESRTQGLLAVLEFLDAASPDAWAAEVATNATVWLAPGRLSEDIETRTAWIALMTAFLNATVLYAMNSLAGLGETSLRAVASSQDLMSSLVSREAAAYDALMSSIRILFDQRAQRREPQERSDPPATSAGLLHKFVIWPMVVGGIQAAFVRRDDEAAGYLCSGMQSIGEELGTVSMIDGARLVEKLSQAHRNGDEPKSWDALFDGAPLFLM